MKKRIKIVIAVIVLAAAVCACMLVLRGKRISQMEREQEENVQDKSGQAKADKDDGEQMTEKKTEQERPDKEKIEWNAEWTYAENSKIHTGTAILYYTQSDVYPEPKTICINAGHGTEGGSSESTLCHPDGSPKVTGGSTSKGAVKATAINEGTTLLDGTSEADMNLKIAKLVKTKLLEEGFNVLMIRESKDAQLDNIARTVIANNNADCHISIHYDSTESDKGAFYISVPEDETYRSMEPVASNWEKHHHLGQALIARLEDEGIKIYGEGSMPIDLTQTSYSTIPSVDLEVGDRASSAAEETLESIADGITAGVYSYFK
ncbi:MAG: N-acetylmuramoyl-L-alanine amidase [Lachnospiraceae bacterium]|nr:N-acetylmuramoyl-L-alanine amidase [Lachnospiraceae bacterium]